MSKKNVKKIVETSCSQKFFANIILNLTNLMKINVPMIILPAFTSCGLTWWFTVNFGNVKRQKCLPVHNRAHNALTDPLVLKSPH